jgi:hypothetical protein
MKILLIIEASLASAEVSAGAVAKADQYCELIRKDLQLLIISLIAWSLRLARSVDIGNISQQFTNTYTCCGILR